MICSEKHTCGIKKYLILLKLETTEAFIKCEVNFYLFIYIFLEHFGDDWIDMEVLGCIILIFNDKTVFNKIIFGHSKLFCYVKSVCF